MKKILLVGGGGHAHSVIDIIEENLEFKIAGIIEPVNKSRTDVLGYPILGEDSNIEALLVNIPYGIVSVGQIKSAKTRKKLFGLLSKFGAKIPNIVSKYAYISKRSSFINPELVREGYASDTSLDIVRFLSEYINGDLEGTFSRKNKFGFDFVQAKSFNASQLINNLMIKIRHIVSNFIICHPSKTNVDWHVANERDLPTNVRKSLDAMEAELKKKNILRGSPYIVDAALAGVKAVIKNASNKNISKQDEMIRQRNLERSKKSIKAENIAADGRNFHNAIINDNKFRSKLNKTLKELLNLELLIVTPKFLKELLQDPSRYQRFRNAQRGGAMYPTGMGRYNRTKFIMLRDLKFKKSFHIHGEEIGKGPTNILPFLAQILSDKPGLTYIIQELENNWHPKYQSKIIELIAKNMKKSQEQGEQGYGNKNFILETHSELFVLQIKKLVEQGILKPEDVSINFIERTKDGNSKVHNIPLNSQGSFTKEWPGGFFTERTEVLTS